MSSAHDLRRHDHPAPASDSLWSPDRRALTIGLVLTITLVAFEALAVSTVMPTVARELGGLELYGWVFSAFFLGSLIGIVIVGGAIDRRGLALPFAIGLGLFGIGLLVGGLAPSMPVLVGARFVQGLGAGTIPPIAYVAIGRSLPERLRPRMFATMSTAWILPGVLGPAIAATVGQTLGWRYVFLGLLPLIGLAGALTLGALRAVVTAPANRAAEAGASAADRARLPLAILVAVGAGLVTLGLTSGEPIPTVLLIGLGLPIGIHALRRLTPAGTLRARPILPAAILLRGILTFMFFGVDVFVPLALVEWRGLSLTESGIALTVATVVWTAGSWVQARGATRWSSYRFVQAGFAVALIGLACFMLVLRQDVSWLVAIPTFALAGFGMGLAYSPLALIVLREATPENHGSASSALSLTDSLGTALGTGVAGAIIAAGVRANGQPVPGLAIAFAVALAVGFGGLLLTVRLHRRPAVLRAGVPATATPPT
ncbi:MAG: MFS transporter [Candidatus Limnocylindrales bacterium]|nr:MFS transporter [Candidatus Limnocylindrales bacterium]